MRLNLPFLLAASSANLKPGGSPKWKKWLMKDVRLLLLFTEMMKIVKLTSPLPEMPRLSRPRLRHGRQLALLSRPNLSLNLCSLSFVLSLALLSHLPPVLTSLTVLFPFVGFSLCRLPEIHFSVSKPKDLRSRARDYLFELRRATCSKESH